MIGEIIGINYDVAVNLGDLIFVVLIAVSGYLVFGLRIYDDRLFVKERDAIKTCRKKGLPLIIKAHPGTGEAYAEVGTKKDPDDILYESRRFGASIDAAFSGMGEPLRLPKRVECAYLFDKSPISNLVKRNNCASSDANRSSEDCAFIRVLDG